MFLKQEIKVLNRLFKRKESFVSKSYWENRYKQGGNSGEGSYGQLADFKAKVLNDFVNEQGIKSVVEFGCGDGNQLAKIAYTKYIGLDVSATIIRKCIDKFKLDKRMSFFLYEGDCFADNGKIFFSDMALSLDVLYHLIEQPVYETYLQHLFASGLRFVVIYSPDRDVRIATHESHRKFTSDVERLISGWELFNVIENPYKPDAGKLEEVSSANFYFYKRK